MNFEIIGVNKIDEYINNNNAIIVDIRSYSEYNKGHIPTAINIPYNEFEIAKDYISKDKVLVLYCERGGTSLALSRDLSRKGYNVKNIYGGISAYRGFTNGRDL